MPILTPVNLWPPVLKCVITWLRVSMPDVVVAAATNQSLSQLVAAGTGVVQVIRTPGGGASGDDVHQFANLDLYFYGPDFATTEALAGRGHTHMLLLTSAQSAGWYIEEVNPVSTPGYVDYGDPLICRFVGSYQVVTTPQAIAV